MLTPDFRFDLSADDIAIVELRNGEDTAYNKRLNLYQHHDFDRGLDKRLLPNWREQVSRVNKKFKTLFAQFWSDLERAERPVLVLGGVDSFRESEDLLRAGLAPPEFDLGDDILVPAAARTVIDLIPHKNLSIIAIQQAARESTVIEPPFYWYRGVDNGYRPSFLPKTGFQHPVNVFEEGFSKLGFAPVEEHSPGSDSMSRIAQAQSLLLKATKLFDSDTSGSRAQGCNYLIAAYRANPPHGIRRLIEETAKFHEIALPPPGPKERG
jgi:hypothetical protein